MLESRFRQHLHDSMLIPDGARVLVGYSGGPDSTALLHLLKSAGVDVVAAHLHHGQRPEADKELSLCEAFAAELGVPFVGGRADVPRMSLEMGIGLEQAGREARYAFFREASARLDCTLTATAHTLSDQIETILFHIVRGSGLSGLAGMPEHRDDIIRPILPFTRDETVAYCQESGFWTHDDPANTDLTFSRARIRHRVIPELKKINPSLDIALLRLSSVAGDEDRFLNGMAAAALEQTEIKLNGELHFLTEDSEMRFDRRKLAHYPPVLVVRAVRLACQALGPPLNFDQTAIAAEGITLGSSGSITTDGGKVVVEWDEDSVDVRLVTQTSPFRYPLTIPGETLSEQFRWQFTAFEGPHDGQKQKRAAMEVALNPAAIRGPLYFRTYAPGDAMQPLGFARRRNLSDLMSEAKLTQGAKSRLPIVCDLIGPVWIPGVCLDARVSPMDSLERAILMRFGTLNS